MDGLAPPISGGTQKAERPTTAQQERVRQIEVALSEIGLQGVPPRLIALWLRDCTVEGVKQAILECGAALVSMPNADSAGRYLTKVISSRVKKAAEQAATAEKAESNHWPFVAEEDEHFNKAAESWSDNDGRSLSRHPLKRLLAWDGRVEGAAKRMPYNAHLGLRAYFAPAAEWVPFWDMVEKHGPPPWLEWPEFQSHKREFEALKDPERRRQLDADIASWKAGKAARANAR